MGFKAVTKVPDEANGTVTIAIAKGKTQLEALIRRLDGLSEKQLDFIVTVTKHLITDMN